MKLGSPTGDFHPISFTPLLGVHKYLKATLRVGAESKRLGFAVLHHMLNLSVFTAGHFRQALAIWRNIMSFEDKLVSAWKELDESRIWKSSYNPPLYGFLRKIGVKTRPGHYRNFSSNFFITFLFFGLLGGLPMWFFIWQHQDILIQMIIIKIIYSATIFGLYMAVYYKLSSRRNNLSQWKQL